MKILSSLLILSFFFGSCQQETKIKVSAGEIERNQSIVKFKIPQQYHQFNALKNENGEIIPLQKDEESNAYFRLGHLPSGESSEFTLIQQNEESLQNKVTLQKDGDKISFNTNNEPILGFYFKESPLPADTIDPKYRRGGYIHPVYTPQGTIITDDYPSNHLHHHGIWAAWTKTQFQDRTPDFWNMGAQTGTVIPVSLDSIFSGPVFAGLISKHDYVDLSAEEPITALHETWNLKVYPQVELEGFSGYIFELKISQQCATDDPLILPEYRYGGVGFRGHWDWNGEENTFFLTATGRDRSDGHATRAKWCHIGGYVDQKLAGITMMDHPDNFRSPQPMRIHPHEPFFNYAPSQAGDWQISPSETYQVTYRFVVYDGEPNVEIIERLWNDFATPAEVTILN